MTRITLYYGCLFLVLQPALASLNVSTTISTTYSTTTTVGSNAISTSITSTTMLSSSVTTRSNTSTTTGGNATTTIVSTMTASTTTTTQVAYTWASTIDRIVFTDIFLHGVTLAAGVVMVVVGKKVPTLLAGNLVLAIFLAMLLKSGQKQNPGLSQWVLWPVVVAVVAFSLVSGMLYCYQRPMVCVITGLVFGAIGLAITVAAALSPFPWGLAAAFLLYIIGHLVAAKSAERPALYKMLSALIGGFLIAHGALFFAYERDFAEEIAGAVVRAIHNSEEEAQSVADDVQPQVAGWLGLSVVLFCAHYILRHVWLKYRAKDDKTKGDQTKHGETEEGHGFAGAV